MYVKKIKIKNYRNFGDPPFEVELKPFTVIVGENNVGKTNLLNALGLIFSHEIMVFKKRILEIEDINCASVQAFKKAIADVSIAEEEVKFPTVTL